MGHLTDAMMTFLEDQELLYAKYLVIYIRKEPVNWDRSADT